MYGWIRLGSTRLDQNKVEAIAVGAISLDKTGWEKTKNCLPTLVMLGQIESDWPDQTSMYHIDLD